MIQIVDFTLEHTELAAQIAKQNYDICRKHVTALPGLDKMPDLSEFAGNNLGVAAFDNGKMLGFLCCYPPFGNAFGSNEAGVFSPMHANGAVMEVRAEIYAMMYHAAAKKWVDAGALSHAICLYAYDNPMVLPQNDGWSSDGSIGRQIGLAQEQFFKYGFGLRCIDAIRPMEEIIAPACSDFTFSELPSEKSQEVLPLRQMLDIHMTQSPIFMSNHYITEDVFMEEVHRENPRFFVAKIGNDIVAYVKILDQSETFISCIPDMKNICGAFCLPKYRGTGIYQNLLNATIRTLKSEGFLRLGVDFESFNPTGYGFWTKYFTPYTNSVVRRIDGHTINS